MTRILKPVWPIAALGLLTATVLAGCPATTADPNAPDGPAVDRRDTELTHEACDLGSSTAKGTDANSDGRPDLIKVFEGGREVCRAVDINMDTIIDVFIYYDAAGRTRRRESGFDRDTRPDEIAYYENGQLVRKERETNNDAKIDTWDYFQNGRLVREQRDSTGDGYIDQWWIFNRPDDLRCALVVSDVDGDGKPDPDSEVDICKDKQSHAAPPKPAEPEAPASDTTAEPAAPDAPPTDTSTPETPAPGEGP